MLLTKTVKMKWNGRNKKDYSEKGYVFTKLKDEFEARVEDLTKGSTAFVEVKCDCEDCKKPYLKPMKWSSYLRYVKENEKYYCTKCNKKLYGTKNALKSRLENSVSFGYWVIKNKSLKEATIIISRWDYDLNKCDIRDVGYASMGINKKGYWFKCLQHTEHLSELKSTQGFIRGQVGSLDCDKCNSFAQWGIDNICSDFLEKYYDYDKNKLSPWEISCGNNKKVWIKCQEKDYHGSYHIGCASFTYGQRCSYCSNQRIHQLDSLGQYIVDNYGEEFLKSIWSEKNAKSAFKYSPKANQEVWWKCIDKKHEDYYRVVNSSNIYKFRCPECVQELNSSIIQNKTNDYLEQLGYNVLHENNCTIKPKNTIEPPNNNSKKRGKGILRYDNEIILNNEKHLIIEVMGKQHEKICLWTKYSSDDYRTTPQQELDYQIAKDKYKKEYAESKSYEYLAVWYYDFKDDYYKKLIDEKIKEIQNKII